MGITPIALITVEDKRFGICDQSDHADIKKNTTMAVHIPKVDRMWDLRSPGQGVSE